MPNNIKLIASDLDGTLLLNKATSCNEELFALLDELEQKGIYFVAASGRQYPNLLRLFHRRHNKMLYLCENGALVLYQNQILLKRIFEDGLAFALAHAVLDNPYCEVVISGERTSYIIPKKDSFTSYIRDEVGNDITIITQPEDIEEPIIKVSYFTQANRRDEVTRGFTELFEGQCLIVTSGNEWVDFAPLGTSKGAAMEQIGKELGILPEEMVAFGDNENDRTMLSYVGHPYLMQDCNPSMLDMESLRCSKVEDSLKELLASC